MSKRKKRSVPVAPLKPKRTSFASQEKKMVIDTVNVRKTSGKSEVFCVGEKHAIIVAERANMN